MNCVFFFADCPFMQAAPGGRRGGPGWTGAWKVAALATTAVCAAVLAVRTRPSAAPRPTALLGGAAPRSGAEAAAACGRARRAATGAMLRQDSLCGALCGDPATTTYLAETGLADCATCGAVNVNIFQGAPPGYYYYPAADGYSYAAYTGYYGCGESSYDPFEWYDYYFKYDPALAPYYEPWPRAAEEPAEDEEPEEMAEPEEEGEEEEPPAEEAPEEADDEAPAQDKEPAEEAMAYPYERPHAQPAGVSTAGSFTMSGKKIPRKRPSAEICAGA